MAFAYIILVQAAIFLAFFSEFYIKAYMAKPKRAAKVGWRFTQIAQE
jgi:hypothetical protein